MAGSLDWRMILAENLVAAADGTTTSGVYNRSTRDNYVQSGVRWNRKVRNRVFMVFAPLKNRYKVGPEMARRESESAVARRCSRGFQAVLKATMSFRPRYLVSHRIAEHQSTASERTV